jgi:uncharacterized protein (DUF1684 family)
MMQPQHEPTPTWLDLYDYRERVARMYRERNAALRAGEAADVVLRRFRAAKDALFAQHPQSALAPEERRVFAGLRYFPYDAAFRVEADLEPIAEEAEAIDQTLPASGAHTMRFRHAARASFTLDGTPCQLLVYWIDVYGGGLFLPFRDATSGGETYGGGRYLFDTVKGSDFELPGDTAADEADAGDALGYAGGRIILDFNYAYNPSCVFRATWICPLAPLENTLSVPVRAGEAMWDPTGAATADGAATGTGTGSPH